MELYIINKFIVSIVQRIWMEKMIEEHSQNDTLWYYANLVYNQFLGMLVFQRWSWGDYVCSLVCLGLYEGYTATADTEHVRQTLSKQ